MFIDRRGFPAPHGAPASRIPIQTHLSAFRMSDVFSKEKRSEIMRRIGPRDSSSEIFVRSLVHRMGYRFRLHRKDLPGNPDIVLPRHRAVIFVHGCFWHGHKRCKRAALPSTNRDFWKRKIKGNMVRDRTNYLRLGKVGWRYLIIWQCQIKRKETDKLKDKIEFFLKS